MQPQQIMHTKSAILLILSALCFALPACSVRALHEACNIVTTADSLRAAGQAYADSAHLAKAYTTLGRWRWFYPDEYAHSCYYYGRLLREKENPVAAMKCFINATHSRTHDYGLLGRVYSNMGGMCRQAEEYELAYTTLQSSAHNFLKAQDSTSYHHILNAIAFVKGVSGDQDCADSLISIIESECKNNGVLIKVKETKAECYLRNHQYDSAIVYATDFYRQSGEIAGIMMTAQAYSLLGQKDSALYYAQFIMDNSTYSGDKYNALYILSHDDSTLCSDDILRLTSDREDVRLQDYEPWKEQLMIAAELLRQDLKRRYNWWSICALIISILLIGAIVRYVVHKRRMKQKVTQIVTDQIDSVAQSIKQHIDVNDIDRTLHWKSYPLMKSDADLYMGGIARKLEAQKLNETEVRFCILTLLDFSQKQIADTIFYSYPSGIKTLKKRISVKLGTDPQKLKKHLLNMLS